MAYFTASCDPPEKNKDFAESLDLDYPILSDPEGNTARKFGVVDENREYPQRWTFYIGKDGRLLHVQKSVKPGEHGQQIADALAELGVAKK